MSGLSRRIPIHRICVNLSAFQGIGRPLRAVAAAILAASEAGILPAGATSDDCSVGQDAPRTGRLAAVAPKRRYGAPRRRTCLAVALAKAETSTKFEIQKGIRREWERLGHKTGTPPIM